MSKNSDKVKIRVEVSTAKKLSTVYKDVYIDKEEWDEMDDEDKDSLLAETKDSLVLWDYKVIDD